MIELEREEKERKDAEASVIALKRRLVSLQEKCKDVDVEIEQYRAFTENLRRGKLQISEPSHFQHFSPFR